MELPPPAYLTYADQLYEIARSARREFQVPVYLVGSALWSDKPRDFDIRLRLTSDQFEPRYDCSVRDWIAQGKTGDWGDGRWKWSRECAKLSHIWSREHAMNIDFQVYPAAFWRQFRDEPRDRLA